MPRTFYRRGPDHRGGATVTFLHVRRRFQFRTVEIGRWVTEPEKQRSAALFYDALCDLMTILGGTESLISLRGTLALQYGIGGQPGVSAHYTPATRSFALAKNAGPGSIAHEWFHAFDHYIADKLFERSGKGAFGSTLWLTRDDAIQHPLNQRLEACYQAILLNDAGTEPSELFQKSAVADKAAGVHYFSKPEELCARAFEAFVQDADCKNDFLVKGTRETDEARMGLYPQGPQRETINAAFRDYFSNLGRALQRTDA
ncbi:CLCA_X family protein [Marinobacter sp. OP 3.4]|uniref:CLCA_X family protein n=1 Tax=Marinobacter sp. OP 3.4 TaxID=3076501 RepID=UPI002E22B248